MSSLLQIASILAERASQKTSASFILEMKDLAVIKRARFLKNSLEKNSNIDRLYLNSFLVPVARVNPADPCEENPDECDSLLRSTDLVPKPIRYAVHPFNYVGAPDGSIPFGWTTFGTEPKLKLLKPSGKKARHTYIDQYIWLFNENNLEYVRVEGVFPDPRLIAKFKACSSDSATAPKSCWNEEQDFFVEEDIAELIIKDTLANELRLIARNEPVTIKEDKNV